MSKISGMPNERIISIFEKLALYYKLKGDVHRTRAYENGIQGIISYKKPITSFDEAMLVPHIGQGLATKIQQINDGKEKDFLPKDISIVNAFEDILRIKEIGTAKATELVKKYGVKSVADLKKKVSRGDIELTHSQKVALKYFNDISQKIPHSEIKKTEVLLKKIGKQISPDLEVNIVGSYRREKPFSNDIDVLLFHPKINVDKDFKTQINYAKLFVEALKDAKIIIARMKESLATDKIPRVLNGEYIIKVPHSQTKRKIDFKMYPYQYKPTAMQYFTGSGPFNVEIRKNLKRKGMKLNEYGLFQIMPDGSEKRIPVKTEEELFQKIGMKYRPPNEREI